jgi:hypothetical protein
MGCKNIFDKKLLLCQAHLKATINQIIAQINHRLIPKIPKKTINLDIQF